MALLESSFETGYELCPVNWTKLASHRLFKRANAGDLPEPPSTNNNIVLLIYLDEAIAVNEPGLRMCEPTSDNAFGFHSDFTTSAGNSFYYVVMPVLDDTCIQNTCPNGNCSLQLSQTQEQRLTQVTSHEFAEMCTDPKFQAGTVPPRMKTETSATERQLRSLSWEHLEWSASIQDG